MPYTEEERQALIIVAARDMIKAWESLPGPNNYSASDIQHWITRQLKPGIDGLRYALAVTEMERPDALSKM
jgi:hypothetical protein